MLFNTVGKLSFKHLHFCYELHTVIFILNRETWGQIFLFSQNISHEQKFAHHWRKTCACLVQYIVDQGQWSQLEMWLVLSCTWQGKQIKSQMQVIASYHYHTRIFPVSPTYLPFNLWPLTLRFPAPFFPVSTVAPQLFSSDDPLMPFFGVLTSIMLTSYRMHFSWFPWLLGKKHFPANLSLAEASAAAVRPGSLLLTRTHAHYKWEFLIHSNKAFGLEIHNKIGAKRKHWGEISWQIDSLL